MDTSVIQSEIQAYDIQTFTRAYSIGRTKVYSEISEGRLKTVKVGRRTLITKDAAQAWLKTLEGKGNLS